LEILFIADQHVHISHDAPQNRDRAILAARDSPELLAEIEVERHHGARRLRRSHAFDDQLGRGLGQGREDSAAVEPPHAAGEDAAPIEVARFEARRRLVAAVVETPWPRSL